MNLEVWMTHSVISELGVETVFRDGENKELGFLRVERNSHYEETME